MAWVFELLVLMNILEEWLQISVAEECHYGRNWCYGSIGVSTMYAGPRSPKKSCQET